MTKLKISKDLSLPLDFVTSTQAILAKKGSGKSYTASVQAEELLDAGQQIVVIDPTGAWWGLRSSANGKSSGYPIAVLGGEHGDVGLETTAAEVIADAIATEHFSAVLDLSLFRKSESNRFMGVFLETLYRRNRAALHIFIDEADTVAPQKPFGEEARTLGATEDVVRRGRIRGLGCTLITQRPQVLNKNVLSQVDMLTALRMNHPKDLAAVKEWVAVHDDLDAAAEMIGSLPSLPIGTAWVWNPAADIFKRVRIRERRTFDSGRTPKAGERTSLPKVLAPIDIARLGQTIASTVERAKENDPKALKAKVSELEKQLAAKGKTPVAKVETKTIEKAVIKDAQLARMEKLMVSGAKLAMESIAFSQKLAADVETLRVAVTSTKQQTVSPQTGRSDGVRAPVAARPRDSVNVAGYERRVTGVTAGETAHPRNAVKAWPTPPAGSAPFALVPAQQKILDTLRLLEQLGIETSRDTLAAWYGAHPNSKGLVNNLGSLRSAGMVDGFGLTTAGRAAARLIDRPTQAEARELIMRPLSPSRRRILDVLVESGALGRDELAGALGMHPNSKGLVNDVGALRTRQLLTQGWPVKAGAVLFMGAS